MNLAKQGLDAYERSQCKCYSSPSRLSFKSLNRSATLLITQPMSPRLAARSTTLLTTLRVATVVKAAPNVRTPADYVLASTD